MFEKVLYNQNVHPVDPMMKFYGIDGDNILQIDIDEEDYVSVYLDEEIHQLRQMMPDTLDNDIVKDDLNKVFAKMSKSQMDYFIDRLQYEIFETDRAFQTLNKLNLELVKIMPMEFARNATMFIYNELKKRIPIVSKISVWETPTSCASYYEE